jgi:hypothetical protein
MVTLVVVVFDKLSDLLFKFTGGIVVLQLDDILHGAMVPLELALGHEMIRCTSNVLESLLLRNCFSSVEPEELTRIVDRRVSSQHKFFHFRYLLHD